jgi:hypothetical protein
MSSNETHNWNSIQFGKQYDKGKRILRPKKTKKKCLNSEKDYKSFENLPS